MLMSRRNTPHISVVPNKRIEENNASDNDLTSSQASDSSVNDTPLSPAPCSEPVPSPRSVLGGRYLLLDQIDGSSLIKCINVATQEELVCKISNQYSCGQALVRAHFLLVGSSGVGEPKEIIQEKDQVYVFFPKSHGDLHSYVRDKRRLRETEARSLFRQAVTAVQSCHNQGVVLRDLKLRKFVFSNHQKSKIRLESLEDAVVLSSSVDDRLRDKHGCPAYVSPEILFSSNTDYSGKCADMWGLGVMLYTMLVGRYPFHDNDHATLFAKIRRGIFVIPEWLSQRAKCLIRCLLRREPTERLTADDVLSHPWLTMEEPSNSHSNGSYWCSKITKSVNGTLIGHAGADQVVPDFIPSQWNSNR